MIVDMILKENNDFEGRKKINGISTLKQYRYDIKIFWYVSFEVFHISLSFLALTNNRILSKMR